jgi:hypothetical protein
MCHERLGRLTRLSSRTALPPRWGSARRPSLSRRRLCNFVCTGCQRVVRRGAPNALCPVAPIAHTHHAFEQAGTVPLACLQPFTTVRMLNAPANPPPRHVFQATHGMCAVVTPRGGPTPLS